MLAKAIPVLLCVLLFLTGCPAKTTAEPTPGVSPPQTSTPVPQTPVPQTPVIPSPEAKNYIGKVKTVEFVVASANYAAGSRGKPTFLNDQPYPNQQFTVVIWGNNRAKFGAPETLYKGKCIRVTGLIESYRGKPQIEAKDPSQIQVCN